MSFDKLGILSKAEGLKAYSQFRKRGEMALSEERVERPKRSIKEKNMTAWLYILRLKSSQLYVGSTTGLDQRYKAHLLGKACRTTQLDPPLKLLYSEEFDSFSDARKREAQIKRWSRAKKEALFSGDFTKLKDLSKSKKC